VNAEPASSITQSMVSKVNSLFHPKQPNSELGLSPLGTDTF